MVRTSVYSIISRAKRAAASFWNGTCDVCGEPLTNRWDDRQRGLCWSHLCDAIHEEVLR